MMKTKIAALVMMIALCIPQAAHACSVCMGANDSLIAPAINAAIFVMLGSIGLMLASIAGFIFYLSRRSKFPLSPHEELAQALASMEEQTT